MSIKPVILLIKRLFAFTVIFGALYGCNLTNTLHMMKKASATHISNPHFGSITIPFIFKDNKVVVTLPVESDGDTKANFILDTGAPTMLSKAFAEKNHISFVPVKNETTVSTPNGGDANRGITFYFVKNFKMRIGDLQIDKPDMLVTDISQITSHACTQIDGVLGSDFLSNFGFWIDFSKQQIILYDKFTRPDSLNASWQTIAFTTNLYEKTPFVELGIRHENYDITWDMGFNGSLLIQYGKLSKTSFNKWIDAHPDKITYETLGAFADITGTSNTNIKLYYVPADTLMNDGNPVVCRGLFPAVRYNEKSTLDKANIGIGFMKHFKMYMNWQEKKIYLKPDAGMPDETRTVANFPAFSAKYDSYKNMISVIGINSASSAWTQGMRPGSRLVKVDGKAIEGYTSIINKCNSDSILKDIAMSSHSVDIRNDDDYRTRKIFLK